jgi:hypothetical protein
VRNLKGLRAREVAERLFMAYHTHTVIICQGESEDSGHEVGRGARLARADSGRGEYRSNEGAGKYLAGFVIERSSFSL